MHYIFILLWSNNTERNHQCESELTEVKKAKHEKPPGLSCTCCDDISAGKNKKEIMGEFESKAKKQRATLLPVAVARILQRIVQKIPKPS